jgi:hypothetical protein
MICQVWPLSCVDTGSLPCSYWQSPPYRTCGGLRVRQNSEWKGWVACVQLALGFAAVIYIASHSTILCIANTVLDIIHHPVFYLKHNVTETGFCLRLQAEHTQSVPKDRISLSLSFSLSWHQLYHIMCPINWAYMPKACRMSGFKKDTTACSPLKVNIE